MRLILISPPENTSKELVLLNQLFEMGLSHFHLRKPAFDAEQMTDYLQKIDQSNLSKIVVHSHHQLIKEFGLKGIHLREPDRKKLLEKSALLQNKNIQEFQENRSFTLSTSIHTQEDLKNESDDFDYVFVSPVFESISKKGYKPQVNWNVNRIKSNIKPDVIALGGIDEEKIVVVKKLGFDGVAVLGAVWNEVNQVIDNFKRIFDKCLEVEPLY